MQILIIEDEFHTAKDLARTIRSVNPDAQIVAMLDSVEDSVAFLKESPALDLIFSDIELGDGLSFEIYRQTGNKIPVIFCTAYNQYALEAFRSAGIDYLLKPFTKHTVLKALEKFEALKSRLSAPEPVNLDYTQLMQMLSRSTSPQRTRSIVVQTGDRIIPLELDQIALFFIENGITYAYTFDQKRIAVNETLRTLEADLSPLFFRANKQFLINKRGVRDATHSFNRHINVNLTIPFEEKIVIGKLKLTAFLEWLSQA